jgi:hypothetical protein
LIYYQIQNEGFIDPYSMFVYAIRFPYTKESSFRRLRRFFDAINFFEGESMDKRCNTLVYRARNYYAWAFSNILKFLHSQKNRVQKKESKQVPRVIMSKHSRCFVSGMCSLKATHEKDFAGFLAAHKKFETQGVEIFHFDGDKIKEAWTITDMYDLVQ